MGKIIHIDSDLLKEMLITFLYDGVGTREIEANFFIEEILKYQEEQDNRTNWN